MAKRPSGGAVVGRLFLMFTLIPLVELALLLRIGARMGFPATLGIVIGTGLAGAALARHTGLQVWKRIQDDLAVGAMPTDALIDGLLILIAGVLLLTPGVLTDVFALTVLTPMGRAPLRNMIKDRMGRAIHGGATIIDITPDP